MTKLSFLERIGPSTRRPLDEYLKTAHINSEDLRGKKILNLGSGLSDLEKELHDLGIESFVANVDINYKSKRKSFLWNLIWRMRRSDFPNNAIEANMLHLPFGSKSFDTTFASWSLSMWLPYDKTRQALTEAIRVTQGNIYITPYDQASSIEIPAEKSWVRGYYKDTNTLVLSD